MKTILVLNEEVLKTEKYRTLVDVWCQELGIIPKIISYKLDEKCNFINLPFISQHIHTKLIALGEEAKVVSSLRCYSQFGTFSHSIYTLPDPRKIMKTDRCSDIRDIMVNEIKKCRNWLKFY